MTTREAQIFLRQQLASVFDQREIEAMTRIIFEDVLCWRPVDIVMREDAQLPGFFEEKLAGIAARLQRHEPLQYILGKARFHGHSFAVTPATLIPRPETEQLVDMIADENRASDLRVLDVGTGSGCIAISLALALTFPQVTGCDISAEALDVARRNAQSLKARVTWERADALGDRLPAGDWDIIVSNPPYVRESERAAMEPNVLQYEPAGALFVPDDDPLLFYRHITAFARRNLRRGGRLYFEINAAMGDAMRTLLNDSGFDNILIHNDYTGRNRFATAVWQ